MTNIEIKGFIETSFCDWDGYLSSVIFLPGCNFRCPFCQNGELVVEPQSLATIDFEVIQDRLSHKRDWIDGVVITGGEPTIHAGIADLMRAIKELGFKVKLDTNGTRPGVIEDLLSQNLLDYIAMDIKAPLDDRYHVAAGVRVDLDSIRRSVELIREFGNYEFRTTLVPGIIDEEAIDSIAQSIQGSRRYVLQRFVPENSLDKSYRQAVPYSDVFVDRLLQIASRYVSDVSYRGKIGVGLS